MWQDVFVNAIWVGFFSFVIAFAAWVMPNLVAVPDREKRFVMAVCRVSLLILVASLGLMTVAFFLEVGNGI